MQEEVPYDLSLRKCFSEEQDTWDVMRKDLYIAGSSHCADLVLTDSVLWVLAAPQLIRGRQQVLSVLMTSAGLPQQQGFSNP